MLGTKGSKKTGEETVSARGSTSFVLLEGFCLGLVGLRNGKAGLGCPVTVEQPLVWLVTSYLVTQQVPSLSLSVCSFTQQETDLGLK